MKSNHDVVFKAIKGIAEDLQLLNQRALLEYTPIVESIINSNSRDVNHIEHTLDGLLGFCGYAPACKFRKPVSTRFR